MKNNAGCLSKYLTKKGARLWRYRFDGVPVDGKRLQIGAAGFHTRREADEALTAAKLAHNQPAAPAVPIVEKPKETVADWVTTWLRDYAPNRCSRLTLQRYAALAGYILNATEGEPAALAATPLEDVNQPLVESALYAILRAPAKKRAHLSPKTVREIAGVLRASLTKALQLGKIHVNPMVKVELPQREPTQMRALAPEEIQRLRDACRSDWTFPIVELSLATGCRRGELLALTWADIDWPSSTLSINRSVEQTRAGLRLKSPKNKKPRKFRIGQSAIATLRFQQEQQIEHRRLCGADYAVHNLVFCQPDGSYLLPDLLSQTIVRRMRKAGIQNASLHTLRHTHASCLLSSGVPITAVSARLGHADSNITLKIYSHAMPDDDARAALAWETIIDSGAAGGSGGTIEGDAAKGIQEVQ